MHDGSGRTHINRTIALIAAFIAISGGFAFSQTSAKPCWYSDQGDFSEHANCLEWQGKEPLRVRGPHLNRLGFANDLAAVFNNEYGWMYVNKKGEVAIAGVASMDNGPDEFRDGFVRYERNGKCGYATSGGPDAIIPQFDGCMPFERGKARVCNGCRKESVGEYHTLNGGEWFCIDTKGKRVDCKPF